MIAHRRRAHVFKKFPFLQFYIAIASVWTIEYLFGVLYSQRETWTYERGAGGCIWKYSLLGMLGLYLALGVAMWFGKLIISYEGARRGKNISNQVSSFMILCLYSVKNLPLLMFYYWAGTLLLFFLIFVSFSRYIMLPLLFSGLGIKTWNSGVLCHGMVYGKSSEDRWGYSLLFGKSLVSLFLYASGLCMCAQNRKWKFGLE